MGRTSDSRSAAATDAYRENAFWKKKCEKCNGTGLTQNEAKRTENRVCFTCNGTGKV